jgi:hypothetical protein
MRAIFQVAVCVVFIGCASNPILTGKPQDWVGHLAVDLRGAWGEPTKTTRQSDGAEIWEYSKTGEFVAPKQDNTSFNIGGGGFGGSFGGSGGINTLKYDQRMSHYENVTRFLVKDGKIKRWFAARIEDGKTVWSDQ